MQISLVNTRGRVIWVDEKQAKELINDGMIQVFNPKHSYYPQYDKFADNRNVDPVPINEDSENFLKTEVI